jgi:hypothetical protein
MEARLLPAQLRATASLTCHDTPRAMFATEMTFWSLSLRLQ